VPRGKAETSEPSAHATKRPHAGRLTGTIVLCIDNDRSILDGMEKLLGGWGCRVLTAAGLTEALAAIEASGLEPDGLLVDYHLDGDNGISAIGELRRRFGRQDGAALPAILITAGRSSRHPCAH
jgi:CheY-like chemotaxis protein